MRYPQPHRSFVIFVLMKKGAAIMLIFYSVVMLSYGSLEMTHDLLHYLAAHHHSHVHDHEHGHHHHFNDHHHITASYSHDVESSQADLPSLIGLFTFIQSKPTFAFYTSLSGQVCHSSTLHIQSTELHPLTPPPQRS